MSPAIVRRDTRNRPLWKRDVLHTDIVTWRVPPHRPMRLRKFLLFRFCHLGQSRPNRWVFERRAGLKLNVGNQSHGPWRFRSRFTTARTREDKMFRLNKIRNKVEMAKTEESVGSLVK